MNPAKKLAFPLLSEQRLGSIEKAGIEVVQDEVEFGERIDDVVRSGLLQFSDSVMAG